MKYMYFHDKIKNNFILFSQYKMRETLKERLQRAKREGRVLDVSNLKENGTGSVIIDQPGPRSSKVSIPELPALVSSHYETYKLATELLGEKYIHHAHRYYNTYVSPKSSSRSPERKRAQSPSKKRPGSPKARAKSPPKKRASSPRSSSHKSSYYMEPGIR